ncbi:MAG: response regulator transcription factor [Actinomycetota bacterium]|nr:response regulator transcription factor [Actinomycetota bacterium]
MLLADDHTMFRQGLKEMLQTDEEIEVVGEAENGEEAVSLARRLNPDVVILDIEMPVVGAREALPRLTELSPAPRVVIVSMYDDPRLVHELVELGASAYLVKSASLEELLTAVHTARSPEEPSDENVVLVLPREALERLDEPGTKRTPSARELEVLLLVARGLSNRQISHTLRLSEATVKRHLANLYPKLGAGSRGEATRKALSQGWISARDVTRVGEDLPPPEPAPPTTEQQPGRT